MLHLKRFVFYKTGGCQKVLKQIEYNTELEIGKGWRGRGVEVERGMEGEGEGVRESAVE